MNNKFLLRVVQIFSCFKNKYLFYHLKIENSDANNLDLTILKNRVIKEL